MMLSAFLSFSVIPAKAGTHFPAIAMAEEWVPAFAGMTIVRRVTAFEGGGA